MKQTNSKTIGSILLRYILPCAMAAAIFALDQYVKNWTVEVLEPKGFIPLVPGVFHLNCTYNTGAAWSMLSGQRGLLLGVTCLAMFCLAYAAFTDVLPYKISRWALFAVMGGALGNFYDRLCRPDGAVVDMFDFCLINFPVFNVADVFICVGGGIFVLCLLLEYIKRDKEFKQETSEQEKAETEFTIEEADTFEIEEVPEEHGEGDAK